MSDARDRAEDAVDAARAAVRSAVSTLAAAGAREEALAEYVPSRRVLLVQRAPTMHRLGSVWRLGVLLLARDAGLRATGAITRATDPRHPNHQSLSAEERRGFRAAAVRAGFADGETVNFDAPEIPMEPERLRESRGPLLLRGDELWVQWNPSRDPGALTPFGLYLDERVELLAHPPQGA